eukprot:1738131-Amphidinium_carterae.1
MALHSPEVHGTIGIYTPLTMKLQTSLIVGSFTEWEPLVRERQIFACSQGGTLFHSLEYAVVHFAPPVLIVLGYSDDSVI